MKLNLSEWETLTFIRDLPSDAPFPVQSPATIAMWSPIAGPSTVLTLMMADTLITADLDLVVPRVELAAMLGINLARVDNSLTRCNRFGLMKWLPAYGAFRVPAAVYPPTTTQRERWPERTVKLMGAI